MSQTLRSVVDERGFEALAVDGMTKEDIRSTIEEVGVVPPFA